MEHVPWLSIDFNGAIEDVLAHQLDDIGDFRNSGSAGIEPLNGVFVDDEPLFASSQVPRGCNGGCPVGTRG